MQEQLMVSAPKQAHAMGKSVRGCDNCVTKGARWYCTADDAFLCESCDSSVHTANPLARRHERVRLKIASEEGFKAHTPSWHQGFTRKARTPRQKRQGNPIRVVPELVSEEESEEQLLYRVPVMESKSIMNQFLLPLELDFAADMLGQDLDLELNCDINMEGLGILEGMEEKVCCSGIIKGEDEEIGGQNQIDHVDYFTYDEEDETENKTQNQETILRNECKVDDSNKALLKLDYERVISAWDDKKSPWTTGEKPEFSPHGWWPAADCCLGTSGTMLGAYGGGEMMRTGSGQVTVDGGREARVSRYREKRRTRLFSKKIRYEVRKLNAEKRPRMKGRFVKRSTSFGASAFPLLNKY